jgi:hypothetical protein
MGAWPVDKSGIVLLNNDGLLDVLVMEQHLNSSIPTIETSADVASRFGVQQKVQFTNWFEFISPGDNKTPSHFKIDVNEEGLKVLERLGLSPKIPAVIEHPGNQRYFYLCGDFAENPSTMWTAKLAGGKSFNYTLNSFGSPIQSNFFKNYYAPLMNSILMEYYHSIQEKH